MSRVSHCSFRFEQECLREGVARVAGVDEAGRGPLAGPVVAAAVEFPSVWIREGLPSEFRGLDDSKVLSAARREAFFLRLTGCPLIRHGVAVVDAGEIDRDNILRATHGAMVRALALWDPASDWVLVDGLPVPGIPLRQTALVKGDGQSYSIAAASILAKVTRDRLMEAYDREWPEYGFAVHKGYPTAAHVRALRALGPCPIHRRSFGPVAAAQLRLGV